MVGIEEIEKVVKHNPIDERDYDVILGLAENRMQVENAARMIFMHPRSVSYRIRKIHDVTGLNPLYFYDLIKLVDMVKEAGYEPDFL